MLEKIVEDLFMANDHLKNINAQIENVKNSQDDLELYAACLPLVKECSLLIHGIEIDIMARIGAFLSKNEKGAKRKTRSSLSQPELFVSPPTGITGPSVP